MKNITVSLPDDVYRQARVRAAERDSTVSAVVREFLIRFAATGEGGEFARYKQLQDEVLATVTRFRASGRLSRQKAHERRAVR